MAVTKARLQEFNRLLQRYRSGKYATEQRVISAENWWRLRNRSEEERSGISPRSGFVSSSGWLHNVITSKHADAMDNYPTPLILPREEGDSRQAELLAAVIPCVLEQNHFEAVYSEVAWQKLKTGTGCYRIVWDKTRHGGLGDISVERANLLNLYWEPGVEDIQKSRSFFEVELLERETLEELYPGLPPTEQGSAFRPAEFRPDSGTGGDRLAVIGVYYRKNGILHYCRYTGETVLESTEEDPLLCTRGIYDHGLYPFVFDPLFPIEGSPCGYGFVDVCRNPQTEIDLLRTAMVENALAGATPRHFLRADGAVNEQEYLDLTKPLVHVTGNLGEDSIRLIPHTPLEGTYITLLEETVNELRETSNNTETSTGNISGNVTAASAITALQEASGKTGRDATRGSYRCYCRLVELCIELIRQFYEVPRCFRITGARGREEFIRYGNEGIRPQPQGDAFGMELGFRLPVFDIRVEAAKKAGYSTQAQNELALRLYELGLLNPANAAAAVPCLDLMDFEGKAALLRTLESSSPIPFTRQPNLESEYL